MLSLSLSLSLSGRRRALLATAMRAWPGSCLNNVKVHTLSYAVRRRAPELVAPASPTPRDTRRLSDLDDRDMARLHMSLALFYPRRRREDGVDPAGVIRRALGEALVHYYPLAGRLREMVGRKLVVDCTGEGVLFVEADADVMLVDLELEAGHGLRPPFPCWDQLLFNPSSAMTGTPLLHIQVTRLLCGGFVFALRFNHTMCDGVGITQFINSVSDLARGLPSITVTPCWSRHLIQARTPTTPTPTFPHPQPDESAVVPVVLPPAPDMVTRCFTFGRSHVAAMKKGLPSPLRDTATAFETLTAFLWRARTMALDVPPGDQAPLTIVVNFRGNADMSLPAGYYGNAVVSSEVAADAAVLRRHGSLGDAVELVRQAKATVTTEYVRSTVDEVVLQGRRWVVPANFFAVSDARRIGLHRLDFGWGEPVFAGPVDASFGICLLVAVKDRDGEDAVAVPVVLPPPAMDRFTAEVDKLQHIQ